MAGFARADSSYHLWMKVIFFALCEHLLILEQCPKGKSSKSYFPCDTDKIIHETEEKIENEFHDEENDARLPNSKPHKFQTKWLNEHKWLM